MKKSHSLRTQLFVLMALLVLLQSIALISALIISRVFFMLDAEAFRLFDNTAKARTQSYNASVGLLVGSMAEETDTLNGRLEALSAKVDMAQSRFYLDDDAYQEACLLATDSLLSLLRGNSISGAFVVLEGSNARKDDAQAHSAIYLRNSALGSTTESTSNYQLEIGPIAVAQRHQFPTSINWQLDLSIREGEDGYLTSPQWAAETYPRSEVERYGYWSTPVDILGDRQEVVTYTMPLISGDGDSFGVLGVEISKTLFNQYYLPNTDLQYENSFYAIASVHEDRLDLDWFIPSGPLAQVFLGTGRPLALKPSQGNISSTVMDGLGEMYASIHPITMYSGNSPFYEDSWSLIGFVPQAVLHETSHGVRTVLIASIALTTFVAFISIFALVYMTTRKISGLSQYVKSLTPYSEITFSRTGIREIDELTAALEMFSERVMNASKITSKILELTLMPLGGFEVSDDNAQVVLTEFIYKLLGMEPGARVSKEAWQEIFSDLIAHPLANYENIYEYTDHTGEERWLRILQAESETGRVGIVLDVSKDIEEHRRLAHELDYDALTHLYSRTAFKREAHQRIMGAPDKIGAMVFVDLDNLKYMNDTFGHDMGDRLIIRAGELFRQFEARDGVVSRISGDEFAIYLHGYDSTQEVLAVIGVYLGEGNRYSVTTPDGTDQRIRFSAGVAYYPKDSDNVTDLLKLSDYAMYEAKHNRKGSIFEFDKESYRENAYLLENREAINRLIDDKLIRFAYQPIVDTRTGEIYAYEALMRPLLTNFKSPQEILSVAEAQSKLGQLERTVILSAFADVTEKRGILRHHKVFINSIPSETMSEEDFLLLKREYSQVFGSIVVEITEEENDSPERMERKIAFIREAGMKLAIDDFGSGYSNETRILSINPDIVKIDIELISGIDRDADKRKLVSNLISYCHPKGIPLVAEGVEREEELKTLIELDIDYVQGFYTGRPAFEIEPLPEEIKKQILGFRRRG